MIEAFLVGLLVGGACGMWLTWWWMRVGEMQLEARAAVLKDVFRDCIEKERKDIAATEYDSMAAEDNWYLCNRCYVVFCTAPDSSITCHCQNKANYTNGGHPSEWQRVRVTARRIEQ